jgi:hypothetical protein
MSRTLIDLVRAVMGRIPPYQKSFSQYGEDMVLRALLKPTVMSHKWSWLDIGAYHPKRLSNTAYFYSQGRCGINVEANPFLIQRFFRHRKRDVNLNVAIAEKSGTMEFYVMDAVTLSTLSAEEAHRYETCGHKILKTIPVRTVTVTEVIDNYSDGIFPDFLSG